MLSGMAFSDLLKMKPPKPKSIKLLKNIRIRQEALETTRKRVQNAHLQNQVRAAQTGLAFQLELQRADALLHGMPQSLQREAILMNRGQLRKRYEEIKVG
jgi:hypothetical protein